MSECLDEILSGLDTLKEPTAREIVRAYAREDRTAMTSFLKSLRIRPRIKQDELQSITRIPFVAANFFSKNYYRITEESDLLGVIKAVHENLSGQENENYIKGLRKSKDLPEQIRVYFEMCGAIEGHTLLLTRYSLMINEGAQKVMSEKEINHTYVLKHMSELKDSITRNICFTREDAEQFYIAKINSENVVLTKIRDFNNIIQKSRELRSTWNLCAALNGIKIPHFSKKGIERGRDLWQQYTNAMLDRVYNANSNPNPQKPL